MMFSEIKAKLEEASALHAQTAELQKKAWAMRAVTDIELRYILRSGLRVVVTNAATKPVFRQAGGTPWAEQYPHGNIPIDELRADEIRELLEIRMVIDAWKDGKYDLYVPRDFMMWDCPLKFGILL